MIVTDNASNTLAAMQLEENLTHVSCFAHTLNLAAQRALKLNTVSRVLGRVRRITGYFHRSTTACEALKVSVKALGLEDYKLQTNTIYFFLLQDQERPGEADSSPVKTGASPEEGPVPKRRITSAALVNLLGKTFTEVRVAPKSASTRAEEELNKYLAVPALSLSEEPLHWWKSNERDFPLLARLAKRYLCIPGTSVAAERVFSTAGDVVTAQRSCLSSEHVDKLMFLQKNLQI